MSACHHRAHIGNLSEGTNGKYRGSPGHSRAHDSHQPLPRSSAWLRHGDYPRIGGRMILFHRLKSLALWIFRRSEVERKLHDDVESFIELSADARIREGATPEEARRLARLEIGGVDQTKEHVRTY